MVCFDFSRHVELLSTRVLEAKGTVVCQAELEANSISIDDIERGESEPLYAHNLDQLVRVGVSMVFGLRLLGYKVEVDIIDVNTLKRIAVFGDAVKLLKQFCAWPLSMLQSRPEPPKAVEGWNYEYVFGTNVRRFIKGRVFAPRESVKQAHQHLLAAELFNRLKRSSLDVTEDFVINALKDHMEVLSKEDEERARDFIHFEEGLRPSSQSTGTDKDLDETFDDQGSVEKALEFTEKWIDKIVHTMFQRNDETLLGSKQKGGKRRRRRVDPGLGACFEAGRADGGAFGHLTKESRSSRLLEHRSIRTWQLFKMIEFRGAVAEVFLPVDSEEDVFGDYISEKRRVEWKEDDVGFDETKRGKFRSQYVSDSSNGYMEAVHDKFNSGSVDATVIPIIEPFKVRVITKGEAIPYHLSKQVQVVLTDRMINSPIAPFFPAQRGPVTEETLTERFLSVDPRTGRYVHYSPGSMFLSGDYKGATDTLRKDVSEYTWFKVAERLSDVGLDIALSEVLKNCLTGHTLHYKWEEEEQVSVVDQIDARYKYWADTVLENAVKGVGPGISQRVSEMIAGTQSCKTAWNTLENWTNVTEEIGWNLPLSSASDVRRAMNRLLDPYRRSYISLGSTFDESAFLLDKNILRELVESVRRRRECYVWPTPDDLGLPEGDRLRKPMPDKPRLSKKEVEFTTRQQRGQLMGSFLSFPILCIVNLAIHLAFFEMSGYDMHDWCNLPILVNGDDVLFMWNKDESALFEPWTEFVYQTAGFVKSVGKNFVSSEFMTINSTLFVVEECDDQNDLIIQSKDIQNWEDLLQMEREGASDDVLESHVIRDYVYQFVSRRGVVIKQLRCPRIEHLQNRDWHQLDVYSMEQVNRQRASRKLAPLTEKQYERQCKEFRASVQPLKKEQEKAAIQSLSKNKNLGGWKVGPQMVGGIIRELIETTPEPHRELALKTFIEYKKSELKASQRPWFLPEDMGGLGLPCLPGWDAYWHDDAVLAAVILRLQHTGKPLPLKLDKSMSATRPCDVHSAQLESQINRKLGITRYIVREEEKELYQIERTPVISSTDVLSCAEDAMPCVDALLYHLRSDTRTLAKLRNQAQASKLQPVDLVTTRWIMIDAKEGSVNGICHPPEKLR